MRTIYSEAPDAIWLAEYTPRWQQLLRTGLPDFPHRLERPDPGYFGAAVYSRHPFARSEWLVLGNPWSPAARVVLQTASGPVGLLGVHPPPPGLSAERAAHRDRGLAAIAPALRPLPPRRVVVGDFNATPWNPSFAAMRVDAGLEPGSTAAWLPTWPAQLPMPLRVPIDHVLVGGGVWLVEAHLGSGFGSDHLPLTATLALQRD